MPHTATQPEVNTATSNAKRSVLLIEDNPGDARLMREYLSEPAGAMFDLEHVGTLSQGLERLNQGGIDLVLLDLSLPDSPMPDTFKRAHAAAPEVPIIVMSGPSARGSGVARRCAILRRDPRAR